MISYWPGALSHTHTQLKHNKALMCATKMTMICFSHSSPIYLDYFHAGVSSDYFLLVIVYNESIRWTCVLISRENSLTWLAKCTLDMSVKLSLLVFPCTPDARAKHCNRLSVYLVRVVCKENWLSVYRTESQISLLEIVTAAFTALSWTKSSAVNYKRY